MINERSVEELVEVLDITYWLFSVDETGDGTGKVAYEQTKGSWIM